MSQTRTSKPRPAFSLIEILIAIIILALGLLGLGALFPVVVRQQRISSDQTLGVIVLEQARAKLQAPGWFTAVRVDSFTGEVTAFSLWEEMVSSNSPRFADRPWRTGPGTLYGEWELDTVLGTDLNVNQALLRGTAVVGGLPTDNAGTDKTGVPLAERLYPSEAATPLLVWDFAAQLTPGAPLASNRPAPMRAAVFVRRVDPRIRVPEGATLRQVLLNQNPASGTTVQSNQLRSPLGVDSSGLPTLDGTDGNGNWAYSPIRYARACFVFVPNSTNVLARRDRLYLPDNNDTLFGLVRQPGQRLVDNLGNIYTVTGSGREDALSGARYVTVSPPVPGFIGASQAVASPQLGVSDTEAIREVIFTPQIPVAVGIVEVNK